MRLTLGISGMLETFNFSLIFFPNDFPQIKEQILIKVRNKILKFISI